MNNFFDGLYGVGHILFLIIFISLTVAVSVYSKKIRENEKKIKNLNRILGICLLIAITLNRIFIIYNNVVVENSSEWSWLNILPNTFCSVSSLILGIALLCCKKDSNIFHFIFYLGLLGGLLTVFYPDFLEEQRFFDLRSLTGLLHHGLLVISCFELVFTQYFTPSIKKWSCLPVGCSLVLALGVFQLDALKYPRAMQIHNPFIKSLPVLTSWYIIGLVFLALHLLFLIIYEMKKEKKPLSEIIKMIR